MAEKEKDAVKPKPKKNPITKQKILEDKKRKEEIQKSVQDRMLAEKRAHETVLALIDDSVPVEILKDAAKYITPASYSDIVTERAIQKMCGYPVCIKCLTSNSKQTYRIDSRTNTVYDISDLKNFCSRECYAASLIYEKQLSLEPVWLRTTKDANDVEVLAPGEIRGVSGKAVILSDRDRLDLEQEVKAMKLESKSTAGNTGKSDRVLSPSDLLDLVEEAKAMTLESPDENTENTVALN